MSDSENKDDGIKHVSLQADVPVREFMVSTAVNFLQNPKVQNSPQAQKRAFLLKKGLTEEEVSLAFQRADSLNQVHSVSQPQIVSNDFVSYQVYKPSIWTRINKIGSAVIIIGIALYGLHQFYKLYIEPWLFGSQQKEDRVAELEKQLLELNRSLSQLRRSVASIEESISAQKEQLHKTFSGKNVEFEDAISPSFFVELKADVATVKSLLLSRHQFPEIPKISPTIPSWQLVNSSAEKIVESSEINKQQGCIEEEGKVVAQEDMCTTEASCQSQKQPSDETMDGNGMQEEVVSTLSASSDSFEHCSSAV